MNAAFLLVTGAMLVGQGDKKVTPPTPPPATPAATSSCNDPCGCEGWGHRMRDRLHGLFNRNNCDSCQPTTCNDRHHGGLFHRGDNCNNNCNNDCAPKFWNHQPRHNNCGSNCGAPANTCTDSCGHGSCQLLSRLRERFARNDCCDGGCGGATTVPAKAGEKIDAPKKMPEAPKKTNTDVRINTPPSPLGAPATIQTLTPPAVEVTPVPVPRVEGDRRDPF